MSSSRHSLFIEQKSYVEILKNQRVFERGKGEPEDAKGWEHESIFTCKMAFLECFQTDFFYRKQSRALFSLQEKVVTQSILVLYISRTSIKVKKPSKPAGTFQNLLLVFYFLQHEEFFFLKIFKTNQTEVASNMKVFTRH